MKYQRNSGGRAAAGDRSDALPFGDGRRRPAVLSCGRSPVIGGISTLMTWVRIWPGGSGVKIPPGVPPEVAQPGRALLRPGASGRTIEAGRHVLVQMRRVTLDGKLHGWHSEPVPLDRL